MTCHKMHGEGGEIGPDITGANRTNLEYLLGNVLTPSAVIQDALRQVRAARLKKELGHVQGYWSQRAKQRGLITENDLQRFLES